jgi:hypothetical protein
MVYASVAPFALHSPHCGRMAVQRRITHQRGRDVDSNRAIR